VIGRGRKGEGQLYVHRLSFELSHGPIPEGMKVCHQCDVRNCIEPAHLFLGTTADNQADMVEKGRSLFGVRHNLAELSAEDVLEIRALWAQGGVTQVGLAARFATTKGNVSQIVRGKRWRSLLPADWTPPRAREWSRA
jgi:hypothetical protein